MKRGLVTATAVIKIPNNCQTKCIIYQANIDCNISGYVTLAHVKQHLKIVSGVIKSRSTTLNTKMIRNYQKNFGKSKSEMEHQKLHGKLSEYAVFTIQTVSAAFYAYMRIMKLPHTKETTF